MRYYNAIQAAKYIGCDPKTVRRMLKRGELTGERTAKGWLAIPGGQVEYAKIKWEEEQAKFARIGQHRESSGTVSNASLPNVSMESLDSIRQLEDRVAQLEEIVTAQSARIASLEKVVSSAPLQVPTTPVPVQPSQNTTPISKPQIASTEPNRDMLTVADFATQIGISYTVLDGYARRGVRGEKLDVTEVPHPTRSGYTHKYFTIEQQQKTLALLRKHGKLPSV